MLTVAKVKSACAAVFYLARLKHGHVTGIGLGIAKCMACDNYNLVLGYHADKQAADHTKEQLEKEYKIQVVVVGGDIAAAVTMQNIFKAVEETFDNECTAFVHNAGLAVGITTDCTKLQPAQDAEFDQTWDYYQKVYPQAFKRGLLLARKCNGLKHVLAISSPGCNATYPPRVGYEYQGQAKAALEFLVRVYASALAGKGINVNCVIPGLVTTEAWDRMAEKLGIPIEQLKHLADGTPAQRWTEPTEVGEAVAFLCSAKGSLVTGVSLPVDGGLHLQHAPLMPQGGGPDERGVHD